MGERYPRASGYSPLPEPFHSPHSNNLSPPFPSEYLETPQERGPLGRARRWLADLNLPWPGAQQEPQPPQSGYLTLIPLSDSRLQPRSTRFTALFLLAFALAVAGSVFLLVPRSVSVGELSIHADRMSWNMTKSTYQLKLLVKLPAFNPNFMTASIEGNLQVLFYGTEAGKASLPPVKLPARSAPKEIDVKIDASDVPSDYILSILTQCSTFPEVLIFFLKGKLTARFLWQRQHLSTIDTYFMIPCSKGGGKGPLVVKEGSAVAQQLEEPLPPGGAAGGGGLAAVAAERGEPTAATSAVAAVTGGGNAAATATREGGEAQVWQGGQEQPSAR